METIISEMMIQVDEKGFYGNFGGAYIPEMLYPNVEELRENWEAIVASPTSVVELYDMRLFSWFIEDHGNSPS